MLIVSLCAALATSKASESLYPAPATFLDNLPVAELTVYGRGDTRQRVKFLVDSGSNRSVLYPFSGVVSGGTLDLGAGSDRIGRCELKQLSQGEMSAAGARLMSDLGIAGALGVDFLRTHDVLIDYPHREIYFSQDIQPDAPPDDSGRVLLHHSLGFFGTLHLKGPSVHAVNLVEQEERFYVPATVEPQTACLMALDTGTGESSLSRDLASGLKETGARKMVAGFQGHPVDAPERIAKIALGGNPPREIKVLVSDQLGQILGSNAFADHWLLLQLRVSRALYR